MTPAQITHLLDSLRSQEIQQEVLLEMEESEEEFNELEELELHD